MAEDDFGPDEELTAEDLDELWLAVDTEDRLPVTEDPDENAAHGRNQPDEIGVE